MPILTLMRTPKVNTKGDPRVDAALERRNHANRVVNEAQRVLRQRTAAVTRAERAVTRFDEVHGEDEKAFEAQLKEQAGVEGEADEEDTQQAILAGLKKACDELREMAVPYQNDVKDLNAELAKVLYFLSV